MEVGEGSTYVIIGFLMVQKWLGLEHARRVDQAIKTNVVANGSNLCDEIVSNISPIGQVNLPDVQICMRAGCLLE